MKIESVIKPNEELLELQRRSVEEIKDILSTENVEAVGGMAVPMMGRSELDILVITEDAEGDADKLENLGYMYRTVADGSVFLKKKVKDIEVAVQISKPNNASIERHRKIIDLMRSDDDLKNQYELFKQTLGSLSREEYKKRKIEWIRENILPRLE